MGERDLGFWAIVSLVGIVALWLVLTPIVPAVASTTMHRFHLASDSFAVWAMQFPIPAMYNFANRARVEPLGSEPNQDLQDWRYINHFPARVMTFADGRYAHLGQGRDQRFRFESTYRSQTVHSVMEARRRPDGVFDVIRVPTPDAEP
jgi:hypothetical protein